MVISLVGYKGGVAKTTSAVHLAAYLQQFAPTLLVDGDPNRSGLHWARNALLPFKVIDECQGRMSLGSGALLVKPVTRHGAPACGAGQIWPDRTSVVSDI